MSRRPWAVQLLEEDLRASSTAVQAMGLMWLGLTDHSMAKDSLAKALAIQAREAWSCAQALEILRVAAFGGRPETCRVCGQAAHGLTFPVDGQTRNVFGVSGQGPLPLFLPGLWDSEVRAVTPLQVRVHVVEVKAGQVVTFTAVLCKGQGCVQCSDPETPATVLGLAGKFAPSEDHRDHRHWQTARRKYGRFTACGLFVQANLVNHPGGVALVTRQSVATCPACRTWVGRKKSRARHEDVSYE